MITEFYGIGNIKKLFTEFVFKGSDKDICFYPYGLPLNKVSSAHEQFSTMQIGNIWRIYDEKKLEKKWCLLATFNIMQFFLFQASLEKEESIKYLEYLKRIWDGVVLKIFKED